MKAAKKEFSEHLTHLLEASSDIVIRRTLQERIRTSLNSFSRVCSNNHRQRLRKLLLEENLTISHLGEESLQDSSLLSQSGLYSSQMEETNRPSANLQSTPINNSSRPSPFTPFHTPPCSPPPLPPPLPTPPSPQSPAQPTQNPARKNRNFTPRNRHRKTS